MEELFGLPAHSLLIHAPITLLPIVALITVVLAVRPSWRRRTGWWMVAAIFAVLGMIFAARSSGQAFNEAFAGEVDVSKHESLANVTFVLTILWFVTYLALTVYERRAAAPSSSVEMRDAGIAQTAAITHGLAALAALLAVLATIWLIRTGHEGATRVWKTTSDSIFSS